MADNKKDTDFYQQGREEIIPRYDKCLNCGRDYMEK
jgi:hypothetical protein